MTTEERKHVKFLAKIELCRQDFWYFCHCVLPDAYPDNIQYLKEWCKHLQEFYENGQTQDTCILNAPPRHKKSLTLQLFVVWILGKSSLSKNFKRIVVACYSQDLSIKFSTNVKNFILMRQANDLIHICCKDVFPDCVIAKGFNTKQEWRIMGASETSFLTCSPGTSITGFGCDILIVDDMYKSTTELYSKTYEETLITFIFSTLVTRFENEKKMIVGMTRWGKEDICQRIIDSKLKEKVFYYTYKACQDDGSMLDENILSKEEYLELQRTMPADVFFANYQQEFIARQNALYQNLKTYRPEDLPQKDEEGKFYIYPIYCVADLADKGTDYMCALFYTIYDNHFYIVDVYYTDKRMADTEEEFAKLILKNNCMYLLAEGNNSGDTYIRNVERIYKDLGGQNCTFATFYQQLNKESRIMAQVSWIEKYVLFPSQWFVYFPKFYVDLNDFNKEFRKNKHDDAADALTILGDCYNKFTKPVRAKVLSY